MQVGPFPPLELLDVKHNAAYVEAALQEMQDPQAEASRQLMASLGGMVLSVDAGIKNAKKIFQEGGRAATAIHTFQNSAGEVVGQFACSNSTKELIPALLRMDTRMDKLPDQVSMAVLGLRQRGSRCIYPDLSF